MRDPRIVDENVQLIDRSERAGKGCLHAALITDIDMESMGVST